MTEVILRYLAVGFSLDFLPFTGAAFLLEAVVMAVARATFQVESSWSNSFF